MEVRKGVAEGGSSEATIHQYAICHACAQRLQAVDRRAIEAIQPVTLRHQELVWKVAVKQNLRPTETLQERHGMRHKIAKDHIAALAKPRHGTGEIRHTRNSTRCPQILTYMAWEEVTVDPDVEGAIAGLFEAADTVVMGGKHGDTVTHGLQMQCRIHDQAFGTSKSQVRM